MESDPFDDILGLEDRFYDEGFQLGLTEGAKAGRIEGRVFGLEKGFEKYIESGRLHGKSLVWASRLQNLQGQCPDTVPAAMGLEDRNPASAEQTVHENPSPSLSLPSLPDNPRLEKHLKVLYALTEPVSLSTDNSEDAVSDFDDRLKRAMGKVKIIERLVGEEGSHSGANHGVGGSQQNSISLADGNIEDVNILKARH